MKTLELDLNQLSDDELMLYCELLKRIKQRKIREKNSNWIPPKMERKEPVVES